MAKEPKEIVFDEIILDESKITRKRTPKYKPITVTALKEMISSINAGFTFTGHSDLILQDIEIEELAKSWHEVIKMYPSFGRYVSQGNTLTVWGKALFTTFIIVERRRVLLTQHTAGSARSNSRDDGVGQDHANGTGAVVSPIRDYGGR